MRRHHRDRVLIPRRARRGHATAAGSNRLAVTAPPPGQFQSAVTTVGASVRVQAPDGQDLLIAGVPVSAHAQLGAAAQLTTNPVTATTNDQGVATFDEMTLTGTAGTYAIEFTAPGYLSATSTGHQLVAGPAVASASDAIVPVGRVGSITVVQVRIKDAQGNILTSAGGSTVTAQVTGTNPKPQSTVTFGANGYRYTYTPATAGTDIVTLKYGGVQISGSPYTSIVSAVTGGFHGGSLRVGYFDMQPYFGTGPQLTGGDWNTTEPIFRLVHGFFTKAELEAAIPTARTKDIVICATFPANPGAITDLNGTCKYYNDTKWLTEFAKFTGSSIITQALKDRVLLWYGPDEPWHSHFCGSFTPSIVRNNFRRMKIEWPDSLCVGRIEPHMLNGWGSATGLAFNYFDKMDYCFATYRGTTRTPSMGESPKQYFTRARGLVAAAGNYSIGGYSHNWPNLGDPDDCWLAFGSGDTRSGRIHGENGTVPGQIDLCSAAVGTEKYWVESTQRTLDVVTAAAEDANAFGVFSWQHGSAGIGATFAAIQKRSDRVQMDVDAVRLGEARAVFNGWRTPK
jgi:hypothetical protein